MNWREYERLLDQKIVDAKYNLDFAEKKHKEATAAYEAVLMEKEAYEKALNERIGGQ